METPEATSAAAAAAADAAEADADAAAADAADADADAGDGESRGSEPHVAVARGGSKENDGGVEEEDAGSSWQVASSNRRRGLGIVVTEERKSTWGAFTLRNPLEVATFLGRLIQHGREGGR